VLGDAQPRFRCLVHGDPHSGNTYLKGSDDVRFMDWQIIHVGTAFHDLAYFLVSTLTVEERRTHEVAVLDRYLEALACHGGPTLTREDSELMIEYRKAMLTGLGWVLTLHSMQAKARVAAMVERYAATIVDHKTIELLTEIADAADMKVPTTTDEIKGNLPVQVNEVTDGETA
jgi:aminoglycoside phosphotransferase (APT) family kinase protein